LELRLVENKFDPDSPSHYSEQGEVRLLNDWKDCLSSIHAVGIGQNNDIKKELDGFVDKHKDCFCKRKETISIGPIVTIVFTGMLTTFKVKCPTCGEELNATDYDNI
jgi:hypothetical protein